MNNCDIEIGMGVRFADTEANLMRHINHPDKFPAPGTVGVVLDKSIVFGVITIDWESDPSFAGKKSLAYNYQLEEL